MNCIIPAQNTKVLAKAINSLAKVGDEIFLEATKDKLKLITLNMSKTVWSQCCFFETFFSSYDIEKDKLTVENNETIRCKLFMKSLLPLLKGNVEKKLDFLKIEFEPSSDFIVFKMKYKYDQIVMVHKLRLMESETLSIGITPNGGDNNLCGTSSLFNQILSMFNVNDSEITLEISNSRIIARNYYAGAAYNPKLMRCEVKLNAGEFFVFDVKNEKIINFALKPLRTVINFAESFNLQVGLNFDSGGQPLTLFMNNPTFEVHFIVSTLNPNRDVQSSLATTSLPASTQRQKINLNITLEDQQALENENWDEVMDYQNPNKRSKTSDKSSDFLSIMNRASSYRSDAKCMLSSSSGSSNTKNTETRELQVDVVQVEMDVVQVDTDVVQVDMDVVPKSPESVRTKKKKIVFGRCYEPTIYLPNLGKEIYGNSDSE